LVKGGLFDNALNQGKPDLNKIRREMKKPDLEPELRDYLAFV